MSICTYGVRKKLPSNDKTVVKEAFQEVYFKIKTGEGRTNITAL